MRGREECPSRVLQGAAHAIIALVSVGGQLRDDAGRAIFSAIRAVVAVVVAANEADPPGWRPEACGDHSGDLKSKA